jgi:hypothetical protein
MSEWPDYKRLRIDSLIHMSHEASPPPAPLCIDNLMDSLCDVLGLARVRGITTVLEQNMIEKAFEERNSSRLQTLVAQVEVKIRNHDAASVCASSAPPLSAAIAPAASSEPEFQTHVQTHNANLASLATFAAVSEYHGPPKVRRGPRTRILVTTADGPVSASSSS